MRLRSSILILSCCLAVAQTPPAAKAAPDEDATFSVGTRLVVLPISVSDKNGKLITDLQQKSFKVLNYRANRHIQGGDMHVCGPATARHGRDFGFQVRNGFSIHFWGPRV